MKKRGDNKVEIDGDIIMQKNGKIRRGRRNHKVEKERRKR